MGKDNISKVDDRWMLCGGKREIALRLAVYDLCSLRSSRIRFLGI